MSSHFQSSHYGASHYLSSHYGRLGIVAPGPDFTPLPVHPPGMSRADVRAWIREEDDLLMAVIMAFLRIKDD